MNASRTTTTGLLIASCGLVGMLATPAAAVCDAYSGSCPTPTPSGVGGGGTDIGGGTDEPATGGENPGTTTGGTPGGPSTGGTTSNPSTLPFTGGELILMTAIGAGALAGGTALVVAGRRRNHAPA